MNPTVRATLEQIAKGQPNNDLRVVGRDHVVGRFLSCEIDSAFQPIARLSNADATPAYTAAQALARVHAESGAELSPWNLFALAASDDDLVLLDRRCRMVHTLNHFARNDEPRELLLNVHERLLSAVVADHGRAFRRVLERLTIDVRLVVIVLPLLSDQSIDRQCNVLASYRLNGFRVAVTADQPGPLSALLARIPVDVARVDSGHLMREGWAETIAAARSRQTEVHATRVDNEEKRRRALSLGATHWQGWHLAAPAPNIAPIAADHEANRAHI